MEGRETERLTRIEVVVDQIQSDLSQLRNYLTQALEEVKSGAAERGRKIDELQLTFVQTEMKWREVERRLTKLEEKGIPKLEERVVYVEKYIPAVKVLIWIAGALGLSIIGLIWALITGQATITF